MESTMKQLSREEYLRRYLGEDSGAIGQEGRSSKQKSKKSSKSSKVKVKLIDAEQYQMQRKESDSVDDDIDLLDVENMPVFVETAESTKLTEQQKLQALTSLRTQGQSPHRSTSSSRSTSSTKKSKKSKKSSKNPKTIVPQRCRHDSGSEADDEVMVLEKEATHVKKFKNQMSKALGMNDNVDIQESSQIDQSTTVHRDEFGRKIDVESLVEETVSKKDQIEELKRRNQERIDTWGKGMKQKEDRKKERAAMKVKETYEGEYTISKEADIELMKQERFNDPMRLLIQKEDQQISQAKANINKQPTCRLVCRFPGPANRFDIKPGHMWDGVDRGNGAEKRYFNMVATKKDRATKAHEMATEDL